MLHFGISNSEWLPEFNRSCICTGLFSNNIGLRVLWLAGSAIHIASTILRRFENPYQSFDFEFLEKFREHSDLPLIYLFGTGENQNWNDPDYDWSNYPKWKNISDICYGIGPNKRLIVTNKWVLWISWWQIC